MSFSSPGREAGRGLRDPLFSLKANQRDKKETMSILYPKLYVHAIFNIPVARLWSEGKRAMIFDLDNTLTGWNSHELTPATLDWFQALKSTGFTACILSNNRAQRIEDVAKRLGVGFVCRGRKPLKKGFREAMRRMCSSPGDTVMVGDQIFTDVLGGNRVGLYTILVEPLASEEYWGTKITRRFEALLRGRMRPDRGCR
jgi:HAD superfamily phosphatase (TIGR01668 family)